MRLLARLPIALALLVPALASPAEAKLGAPIASFTGSKLIQGDRLFHFEGRTGARYRFTGARRCKFGQGMLVVDVINQHIVQQVVVLPLPTTGKEEDVIREVAGMFVDDLALDVSDKEKAEVLDAFVDVMLNAKPISRPVGKHYELRVSCQPRLNTVMMAVGLKT
jgi:hypothetical protein